MPDRVQLPGSPSDGAVLHHVVPRDSPTWLLDRASGLHVWDADGRGYLDMTSGGVFAATIGFGREDVVEAMARQASRLCFTHPYGAASAPVLELASRISAVSPIGPTATYFCNSGSEAMEAAVKFARQYHVAAGEPQRSRVVARRGDYHGSTLGAVGTTGSGPTLNTALRGATGPDLPGYAHAQPPHCFRCELGLTAPGCRLACATTIEQEILSGGPDTVSCVVVEPVMTTAGAVVPPAGYFDRVREICDRYGALLVSDEVVCGFGRLGSWFGAEPYGVRPDIMIVAKGLTGGYAPMGAMVVRRELADAMPRFLDAHTTGGHPVAAAAAVATMDVLDAESLLGHARRTGAYLLEQLRAVAAKHPGVVADVRGDGLFTALDLAHDPRTPEPYGADLVAEHARDAGVLVRAMAPGIVVLAPALVVSTDAVDTAMHALDGALAALASDVEPT